MRNKLHIMVDMPLNTNSDNKMLFSYQLQRRR